MEFLSLSEIGFGANTVPVSLPSIYVLSDSVRAATRSHLPSRDSQRSDSYCKSTMLLPCRV
jgi:hypothetical protein